MGLGRKSGLVVNELDSLSIGLGFESLLIQHYLDGNGIKAMPGLIPVPNTGSFRRNKRKIAKWDLPTNKFFKLIIIKISIYNF